MAREPGARRPRAVRLGVPAAIVLILAVVALWRVQTPGEEARPTSPAILKPIATLVDVLADNTVGREASIERVPVLSVVNERLFLAGDFDHTPVYVTIDPSVTAAVKPGERVTLIGRVEAAPDAAVAEHDWGVDEGVARAIRGAGVYLNAREVRPTQ